MKHYERNWADQDLVVHRLTVLGDVKNSGITQIRSTVDSVKQQQQANFQQQEKYWTALSADEIISPIEKQSLKRELENIRQSYTAVTNQATSFGYTNPVLTTYEQAYTALRTYCFDTLKLFDHMESDTKLPDRAYFNSLFANYFFMENFVLLAITKGILDTVNVRILESLTEEGEEGEAALYKGGLYQYVNGEWRSVSTGDYKGLLTELPASVEDSFFLAADDFTVLDNLIVNGEELYVNSEPLLIQLSFVKGYIYYCKDGAWWRESDKTNYRYVAAFADVLNLTGELPQIFQDALDNLEEQIQNIDIHTPEYKGAQSVIPSPVYEGDFFVYKGATSGTWHFASVYRYHNSQWQELDSENADYSYYYMTALQDILAITDSTQGYFNSVFASSFFGNVGVLEQLSVTTIELKQTGVIKSQNFEEPDLENETPGVGFRLDADGNIDAYGDTRIGGMCEIGGTVKIGGSAVISGSTTITGDTTIRGNALFCGNIDSGPLYLSDEEVSPAIVKQVSAGQRVSITTNSRTFEELFGDKVDGHYGNISYYTGSISVSGYYQPEKDKDHINITIRFYNKSGALVYTHYQEHNHIFTYANDVTAYAYIETGSKTMKLIGLPIGKPNIPDMVYVDTNGFLRLS